MRAKFRRPQGPPVFGTVEEAEDAWRSVVKELTDEQRKNKALHQLNQDLLKQIGRTKE